MPARLTLNIFSPLPPARTNIANFTSLIVPALAAHADLRLWHEQEDVVPPAAMGIRLIRYAPDAIDWRLLNEADFTIYNIGNHAGFHAGIAATARRSPGLVVLHDTRLQHLALADAADAPGRARYLATMRRCYGAQGSEEGRRALDGHVSPSVLAEQFSFVEPMIENALGYVVHDPESAALLAASAVPGSCLALPGRAAPVSARPATPLPRRPGAPIRLLMFGFLGANRRVREVLAVLAGCAEGRACTLDIIGEIEEREAVARDIARLDLGDRVRLHGYVSEDALEAALAASDLAINLRWPSMGEASGSQLRIWEASLPALVTRAGWYATLPEDSVAFVDPAHEADDIRRHLRAFARAPDAYAALGRAGRALLERRHSPEAYAAALIEIARREEALHAVLQARRLSIRAGEVAAAAGGARLAAMVGREIGGRIAELVSPA